LGIGGKSRPQFDGWATIAYIVAGEIRYQNTVVE